MPHLDADAAETGRSEQTTDLGPRVNANEGPRTDARVLNTIGQNVGHRMPAKDPPLEDATPNYLTYPIVN